MSAPGSVAPLAVDTLGKGSWKYRLCAAGVGSFGNLWVAIVAEHALEGDPAPEVLMVGAVVARIHRPITALFRVPADWQLNNTAIGLLTQIRSGMISRTHDKVDLLFHHV